MAIKRTLVFVVVSLLTGTGIGYWAAQGLGSSLISKIAPSSTSTEEQDNTVASGVLWLASLEFGSPQLETFDFEEAKALQEQSPRFGDYLPRTTGVHYVEEDVVYLPMAPDARLLEVYNTRGGFDDSTRPRGQVEELRNSSPYLYDSIPEVNRLLRE